MKKLIFLILAMSLPLCAQTTYTTTADGCGAKNLGYCRLSVDDQNGQPFDLVLDTRNTASGPINTVAVNYPWPGSQVFSVHGVYSGFVPNPNGTHTAYYGSGSFLSDDKTAGGNFTFYAYYVASCSGRGCAGTVVGWHYKVLTSSVVTAAN